MNVAALEAECYRRIGATTAPPSDVVLRIIGFLNVTQRQILGLPGMEAFRDDTITFASVSGQSLYGLPQAITRIESITDRTTMLRLRAMSLDDLRAGDPGLVTSGPSDSYIVRGYQAVSQQPSAAAEIFAKSTAAGDTTQIVRLEVIRTGGYFRTLSATLTGTTAVSLGATVTDVIEITKCYLSALVSGTVTVHQTSGAGTELARFGNAISSSGNLSALRYLQIQLYPTPTSALTYHIDYVRTIQDWATGSLDEPLIPDDFHWLLVEGAVLKEWTKRDDDRRVDAKREFERGLSALRYWVNCPADFLPSRGSMRNRNGRNRLGANYGDTSW